MGEAGSSGARRRRAQLPRVISFSSSFLAKPKSVSLRWPSSATITFSGLRSRYRMPSSWRCCSASAISPT
eukprot:scaffold289291_cov30-Tisochrysis_lutea.AAC.1